MFREKKKKKNIVLEMPVDTGEEESMFSMAEQCTVAKILSAHLVVPGGVIVDIRVALNASAHVPTSIEF